MHIHLCACGHDITWHRYFAYSNVTGPCRLCKCASFQRTPKG